MDVEDFVAWWHERSRTDIEAVLRALDGTRDTADGAVCWMLAAQEVDVALRRHGDVRVGSEAAHRATVAVLRACDETGLSHVDRSAATRLARAAAQAARCLAAGRPPGHCETLLRPFFGALALPA